MVAAGFVDVAAAPSVLELGGCELFVAGNERPWIRSPDPFADSQAVATQDRPLGARGR